MTSQGIPQALERIQKYSCGETCDLSRLKLTSAELEELIPALHRAGVTKLDVSYNQLEQLPEALGQCSALWKLDVSNNQLSQLPEALGQLKELRVLDISNTYLQHIPESGHTLSELERRQVQIASARL